MLPFKVHAAIVCDDVRQEQNNKAILIGVYNGRVLVQGFPAEIPLMWWIQLYPHEKGDFPLEVQLVKEDGSALLRGLLMLQLQTIDWSALTIPRVGVQFQSAGRLRLQMRRQGEGEEWQTIHEIDVEAGMQPS